MEVGLTNEQLLKAKFKVGVKVGLNKNTVVTLGNEYEVPELYLNLLSRHCLDRSGIATVTSNKK